MSLCRQLQADHPRNYQSIYSSRFHLRLVGLSTKTSPIFDRTYIIDISKMTTALGSSNVESLPSPRNNYKAECETLKKKVATLENDINEFRQRLATYEASDDET
eukprot:IDg14716t1